MKVIAGALYLTSILGDIAFLYWQLHQVNILRKYITQCAGIRRGKGAHGTREKINANAAPGEFSRQGNVADP